MFDYTGIADWVSTVIWITFSYPMGVVYWFDNHFLTKGTKL